MLNTCVTANSTRLHQHMNYGSVITRNRVQTFEAALSKDAFLNIVYTFLRIRWSLRNPKIADYKKALETFRQQHYHAFLYHHTNRNKHCQRFIQTLQDFEAVVKKSKKHYVDLFETLCGYSQYMDSLPGGHFKGTPFVFTDHSVQKWFYDEVKAAKKKYNINGSDLFYPVHADGKWTGHVDCPANRIGVPKKMSPSLVQYLVHVGYETLATASQKWNIPCTKSLASQPYALVQQNVDQVNDLLHELDAHQRESREDCIRLHMQSRKKLRERVFERIVQRYDDSMRQLSNERDKWRLECEQAKSDLAKQEMLLASAKRKIDNLYEDIHHLDKKRQRAHDEAKHLTVTLRQKDDALRQSIDAQWQLYRQLHR